MNALRQARQSLLLFIAAREVRERRLLLTAAVALGLLLVYLLLLEPAMNGRTRLRQSLPVLHQQVAQMRSLAAEARQLSASTAVPATPLTRESVQASLARVGLNAQSVAVSGASVKVQLADVSFAAVTGWLQQMQKSAHATVADASIRAREVPGMVDATVVLQRAGGSE